MNTLHMYRLRSLALLLTFLAAVLFVLPAAAHGTAPEGTETAGANAIPVYNIYVSAPGSGKVSGINYADEDVLRYTTLTNSWTMFFDGSAAGLPGSADIDAISLVGDYLYMSFDKPLQLPGLGLVDDSDVVTYNQQSHTWSFSFGGAADGLTTDAEDIDALLYQTFLTFSTTGNFTASYYSSFGLEGTGGDLFGKDVATFQYYMRFDGSEMGLGKHNITSAAYIPNTSSYFLVLKKGFQINGVTGAGNGDILRCNLVNNQCQFTLFWDASDHNFPKVDALDIKYTTVNLP